MKQVIKWGIYMSYSFDSRIRFSELGEDRKLTINSIINYFQDCSNFHSQMLDLGIETLEKRQRAWMLSAWQINIKRRPVMGEEVTISTWPYDFKGFYGYRNFVLQTKVGEIIAYANSIWVYLNSVTGSPVRIDPQDVDRYGMEEKLNMEYAPRKIVIPQESTKKESFTVMRHHLDVYHHVNNGQYIQMAIEYIPADFEIHQLRVEYKNQAVLGSVITPLVSCKEGIYTVTLANEENLPYAVVAFQ